MDKKIKMLLIKLSPKYKVTITTTIVYNAEKQSFGNIIRMSIKNRFNSETHKIQLNSKMAVVQELMTWLKK